MGDLIQHEFEALRSASFRDHDGLILRDGSWTAETLAAWRERFRNDPAKIEAVINHVHLRVLYWQPSNPTLDEVRAIGWQIRDAWHETLRISFPARQFQVVFEDTLAEDGSLDDFQITAFEVREV